MKKILFLIPIIVISWVGCQEEVAEVVVTKVIITGSITNPIASSAVIRIPGINSTIVADTITVDDEGNFATTFDIDAAAMATFKHGRERTAMFITPGDSIHIQLDAKEFDETISYSGLGADASNFLAAKYLMEEGFPPLGRDLYLLDVDQFLLRTDSIRSVLSDNLSSFKNEDSLTAATFFELEKAFIDYSWAQQRLKYPDYHIYYTKDTLFQVPEGYDDYLGKLNLDDENLVTSSVYRNFITSYVAEEASKLRELDTVTWNMGFAIAYSAIHFSNESFTSTSLKNYVLFKIMDDLVFLNGVKDLTALIADFDNACTNDDYKTAIHEDYTQWQKLAEGKQAPDFSYPNIEGDTVSLSDFRGKYVYIDVWATWCGPCKREIPDLAKLEEEYADKDIVFMSVSIDDTSDPWKKMVADKELKGVQLWAEGWSTPIAESYMIQSIPRFMLIDKEGMIININAKRPSGGIKDIFDELLEDKSI